MSLVFDCWSVNELVRIHNVTLRKIFLNNNQNYIYISIILYFMEITKQF